MTNSNNKEEESYSVPTIFALPILLIPIFVIGYIFYNATTSWQKYSIGSICFIFFIFTYLAFSDKQSQEKEKEEYTGLGYSLPLGVPFVIYPILLAIAYNTTTWFKYGAHTIFFILVFCFFYTTLSKDFTNIPGVNRPTWILKWGPLFVLFPLIAWHILFL